LAFIFLFSALIQACSGFFELLGLPTVAVTLLFYMILAVGVLFNLNKFFNASMSDLIVLLLILLAYIGTLLFTPKNFKHMVEHLFPLISCAFHFMFGRLCRYCHNVMNILYHSAIIGLLLSWFSYFTSLQQTEKDMTFAYLVLPFVIICIYSFAKLKKIFALIGIVSGIVLLFLLGTRGPLVFAIIYLVFCMLVYTKKWMLRVLFLSFGIAAVFILVSGLYMKWLTELYEWLLGIDIDSFILKQLIFNDESSVSERAVLFEKTMELISKNQFLGVGLFGERSLIGGYPHNILLEILVDFGGLLGGAIILLSVLAFALLWKNSKKQDRDFLIVLIFSFALKMFISASYITDSGFWLMVGCFLGVWNSEKIM